MKSFIFVLGLLTYISVHAEITLDGTLGTGIALEGPNFAIGSELGQQHGSNLFHSFGQFNLNNNESATFSGPLNINNVIGRVTGGRPSNIDGLIRSTIPNADVYLINPAGMLFGPNATLDVQGSFHASTADTLRFQDGGEFNASNPQNSLLTIAPISAFGFLTDSPQPLSISGSATKANKLSVPTGNTLSLIGGNIQVSKAWLSASSGRINIAGVAGQGDVTISPKDLILPGGAANVSLEDSTVNVSGNGGGHIYIRAGQFFIDNTSIDNSTRDAAAGEINVQAENLIASRGGRFGSTTIGTGQGGQIKIKVNELTEFSGEIVRSNGSVSASGINLTSRGTGNAGTVELETAKLNLKEGARISATTFKSGKGGNINIQATDSIALSGFGDTYGQGSSISASTRGQTENAGQGGVIALKARELELADGALITTITFGTGQGGHVKINTTEDVTLSGEDYRGVTSGIWTEAQGSGDGGRVELKANQLTLLNGTNIRANSSQSGQGGQISINVNDLVKLEGLDTAGYGSYIMANAQGKTMDAGNGGTIEIIAGRLQLADGAQISTSTFGPGQGGELAVNVTEKATFSGQDQSEEGFRSGLLTTSEGQTEAAGNGGTIVLVAGDLRLADNGEINAMTFGQGVGGNINIQAQTVKLTENSTVMASSEERGDAGQVVLVIGEKLQMRDSTIETKALNADGGNLEVIATSYVHLVNSRITTSVSEEFGGGGNIILNPKFVVLDGSQVFAKAKKGAGGNINITTTGVYNFTNEAIAEIINASSEFGVNGLVTIATPDNNSDEAMLALPATLFDASTLLDKPCGQRLAENLSHFIVIASEGTSNESDDLLPSGLLLSKQAMTVSSETKNEKMSLYPLMALLTECKTQEK